MAAITAAILGLASAGMSIYWSLGGDGLLETVGGGLERWARDGGLAVVVILFLIAVVKTVVAVAAPILTRVGANRLPTWTSGHVPRVLGWIAAVTLTVYGVVLTFSGLLVETGIIESSAETDTTALAWHTYFWDPWFAIWGIAFIVALWRSSGRSGRT